MSKVLITGIGLISQQLGNLLIDKGYTVNYLTRNTLKHQSLNTFKWDLDNTFIDIKAFEDVDFVIHLAGTGISDQRWTDKRKQQIIDSRVKSTELLFNVIKKEKIKIKAFIAASAIGFYGAINSDTIFSENNKPSNDFLGTVCVKWEYAIQKFSSINIRTIILRTGVVFDKNDGAFPKLVQPIRSNYGAILGNGKQYIPWIHISDLCNLYIYSIENSNTIGIYNAVAPSFNSSSEITRKIAKKLDKLIWLPNIPSFILKLIFGQMAEILLYGSRISPQKIIDSGFNFQFSELEMILEDLLE